MHLARSTSPLGAPLRDSSCAIGQGVAGQSRDNRPRPVRGESGMIGGIEAVLFGLLIFVGGTLVIANVWGVVDAKMAAGAAAREAARSYVKAPAGADQLPLEEGTAAGERTLRSMGWHLSGRPVELVSGGFTRCSAVTFRVTVPVPMLHVPWLDSHGPGFQAVAQHTEVVDPFRSGVRGTGNQGSADCG